jgi:hypothetical protein
VSSSESASLSAIRPAKAHAARALIDRWQRGWGHALRLTILLIVIAVPLVFWPAYLLSLNGLLVAGGTPLGADFAVFWSAASLAAEGRADAVLDPLVFTVEQQRLVGETFATFPWFYPPHLLVLLRPLGLLAYVPGWLIWSATGFAAFAFTSFHAARRFSLEFSGVAIAGLLFAPAAMMNLIVGQLGFFTSALLIGGVTATGRRPVLAGVLFGLLTVKPHLGLLVPFLLIASRAWRTVIAAVVTTAILLGCGLLLDGPEAWRAFAEHSTSSQWSLLQDGPGRVYNWMPSVFATAHRFGVPFAPALAVQFTLSIAALIVVVRGFYQARDPLDRFMLLALGTFVVLPYTMAYDMAVLVTATLLYVTYRRGDLTVRERWVYLGVWLLPFGMVLLPAVGAFCGPLVLGTALVTTLRRVSHPANDGETRLAQLAAVPRVIPIIP